MSFDEQCDAGAFGQCLKNEVGSRQRRTNYHDAHPQHWPNPRMLCTFLTKLPQVVIKRVGKDVFEYLQDSNFITISECANIFCMDVA